jgi:hypothetical protein
MNLTGMRSLLLWTALLSGWRMPCDGQPLPPNAAQLSVELVRGLPGITVPVPISLLSTGTVVAAQFDLTYPSAHLGPGDLGPGTLNGNVLVRWRQVSPGVLRYLIYSPQNSPLQTNALVGTLPMTVPAGEKSGGQIVPGNVVMAAADASLVNPIQLQTGGVIVEPNVVFKDGSVDLMFNAQTNIAYIVQATTNFFNWVNLATNTATVDYLTFTDDTSAGLPYRFYRLAPMPEP